MNQPPTPPTVIEISTPAKNDVYAKGERIDTTGLVLAAHFPSGVKDVSKGFSISPKTAEKVDDNFNITVTYRGKKIDYTVKVKQAKLLNMQLKSNPTKTRYIANEAPNWAGMKVTFIWTDRKETVTLTDNDNKGLKFDFDMKTVGFKTVTASFTDSNYSQDFNVRFDIYVGS